MSADVLLVRPPFSEFSSPFQHTYGDYFYPIGLAYLAAALKKSEVSVEVFDSWAGMAMRKVALPAELAALKPVSDLRSCRSERIDFCSIGAPLSDLERLLRGRSYPIIGVTSMFSGHHLDALRAASRIKKACPDSWIVMGGHATTVSPELTLNSPGVDFIVQGEGDEVFPRLARFLLQSDLEQAAALPGVGSKIGGALRINRKEAFIADLDSLAAPEYEAFDPRAYKLTHKRLSVPHVTLFTSRGCPHLCDFCTIHLTMGRPFRAHSPRRVLDDIRRCHEDLGVGLFYVEDDNFAFDGERAKKILNLIIEEFGPRRLTFRNHNGMTALSLADEELVRLMAQAGFDWINIALESADLGVRRIMKKPGSVAHFTRAAESCMKAGIDVGAFTILGLPYSSLEQDIETQLFCLTQNLADCYTPMYYPIPMTPQYERCVANGWIRRPPKGMPLLRSETFAMRRADYSRRAAFTLAAISRILWAFKQEARYCAREGEAIRFEEVFRRRSGSWTLESTGEGGLMLESSSTGNLRCAIRFVQAEGLLRRGQLLCLREASGTRAVLSGTRAVLQVARASGPVLDRFLGRLPMYPIRLVNGAEIRL